MDQRHRRQAGAGRDRFSRLRLAAVHGGVQFDAVQRSAGLRAVRYEGQEHVPAQQSAASGRSAAEDNGQGFALADWAGAPVNASHLVFGYTAAQNGALVLYGNVDDTRQTNPQSAQLLAQRYAGSLDEAGAIHVAHEFANDIIQKFGGTGSLLGSRIYFVSQARQEPDEIWAMDWDGDNQKATDQAEIAFDHASGFARWLAASRSPVTRKARRES